ncbi:MAG: hypothetical protein ACOX5Z_12445 [Desulfobulbus sp.]|jgi:type II secretory pathway pseudopilin PulG
MSNRFHPFPRLDNESGFVLVLSLVVLVLLSLFGVWALQTSDSEIRVAAGQQRLELQFNVAEGAANVESAALGFNLRSFYELSNPGNLNRPLIPSSSSEWNPGNDAEAQEPGELEANVPATWPWGNLAVKDSSSDIDKPALNAYDYRYLVTYLYPDSPPKGYDSTMFSGYRFRVQGNAARTTNVVELGGIKLGAKMTL